MKKGWREWTDKRIASLSNHNFVISMDFKTTMSYVSLFEMHVNGKGWDREIGLKNGKPYVRVWRGRGW